MSSLRDAINRVVRHYEKDPDGGAAPDAPAVAVREGPLRMRVSGPNGDVVTDGAKSIGGDESGPTPGWLLRAALASCNATVIAIEAARDGVELTRLEVTVNSETDLRGTLGLKDVPAGPAEMHVQVVLASDDAGEEQLREIAGRSSRSPVGDAMSRVVPTTTEIVVA
jgi:uncharacterized OsmC-like protein